MKAFRHAGIVVSNMEKALRFYRDLLGLRVVKDLNESGEYIDNLLNLKSAVVHTIKLSCDGGDSLVELLNFTNPSVKARDVYPFSIGPTHVAFEVEDLDMIYRKLNKARVSFNSIPQNSPDGFAKVAFCKDPDGTLIELVELRKK